MPIWECKLSDFEGPMDLLLELVRRNKIDLADIFVSEITEQYLKYMEQINDVDMERASDFLNTAALLLYLKSRSLLPSDKAAETDMDFIDPQQQFIEMLSEYQKYKEAAGYLQNLALDASKIYYKSPENVFETESDWSLGDADVLSLFNIFSLVLERAKKKDMSPYVKIKSDSQSVRIQKMRLLDFVFKKKKAEFFDFFDNTATHQQITVTFFAMLELWHEGKITVIQVKPFAPIILLYNNIIPFKQHDIGAI